MATLRPILLCAACQHPAVQDKTVREVNQIVDDLELYLLKHLKEYLKEKGNNIHAINAVMDDVFNKYKRAS